ncbi:MAG: prolipoprotein diacylglyceryl transferase [Candidatus Lightella neohaematopini]|nr:prolipoprotein diacylglyceryl transferase [Candidatus Lightella neohaematopini]
MKYSILFFNKINPVIFNIGFVSIRWYGLMYILAFFYARYKLVNKNNNLLINKHNLDNLLYYCFLGLLLGGRIGYMIFYNLSLLIDNPLILFKVWNGGMSFHGGLIGVILVIKIFSYKNNIKFFYITDIITPTIPFGLGIGRLGNFINGELWGKVINHYAPLAVIFPNAYYDDLIELMNNHKLESFFNLYHALPRHPSQLYELMTEGILLFFIIQVFRKYFKLPVGSISGLFLVCYSIFRILVENFRQSTDINILIYKISIGQLLSIPMLITGIIIIIYSYIIKN